MTSRYEVLLPIASGGMATVYAGRVRGASGFSRLVAIKRPHTFVAEDSGLKQQLAHEAHVASLIHHPNVVSVLDVEKVDEELLLVMDYVEGCSLKDLLDHAEAKTAAMDAIAIRILLDVSAGLHAAHRLQDPSGKALGVVHRDVSPHNVLVGVDGVARLADFGIAKIANAQREETMTNVLKGKFAYLPPEYVESRTFTHRSDLYSLGVVAWEALAQQRLFKGASASETLRRVVSTSPARLGTVREELAPLEEVVASALARQPDDRPESVEDFARVLEECARKMNRVATHAEVGALVERVAGTRIAERRRSIEHADSRPIAEVAKLEETGLSERDRMATESLVVPSSVAPAAAPQRKPRWYLAPVALGVLACAAIFWPRAPAPPPPPAPAAEVQAAAEEPPEPEEPPVPTASTTATPPPAPTAAAAAPTVHARSRVRSGRPASAASSSPVRLPTHAPPNPYEREMN
jgi:hypothetical protein